MCDCRGVGDYCATFEKKSMFLKQSFTPENKFWKYLVGSVVVILAAVIGQGPMLLFITAEAFASGRAFPATNDQVMGFLEPNLTLFLLLISFAVALLGLYLVVKVLHRQDFKSIVTARPRLDWGRIFFAFTLWALIVAVTTYAGYLMAPEDYIVQFRWDKFLILAAIAIPLIPVQTSVEEFVFRGYLMQGFANLSKTRLFPLVMTSVIFGVMHVLNPEVEMMGYIIMVFYIGTGLFLGITVLMDDGLELALGFHAANNLVAALLVTADWTAFQTHSVLKDISEPDAGFDVVLPVLVIFPIVLFIFSKRYRWSGWLRRLTGLVTTQTHDTDYPNSKIY